MHAPHSDSESVNTWTSSVRPDLEEPERKSPSLSSVSQISPVFSDFGRTNGMGTWYCTVCTRSPALAHLFSFDPAGAETHEHSAKHRATVAALSRSWMLGELPADEAAWGIPEATPFADMRAAEGGLDVYTGSNIRQRVRAWRRECVIAQGGTLPDEEECEEECEEEPNWDEESEVPITETTHELHAAGPLLAAVAAAPAPQLIISYSDSSDSSSDSTDVIAKCNRIASGTSRSDEPLPSALVTFKAKTMRSGLSKLAALRNSLRWLGWPAQKSIERVSRIIERVRR
ncbi:hypothetical protein AURDEDRAFT_155307 [Auricularia subglabra TFB-10046 SS5]|nr:hypothetical protein AURDEDRAFT_155307 [Auricularia subglabra TFB-10046 SS5]